MPSPSPTAVPTSRLTPGPTWTPTPAPTYESCAFTYLHCDTVITGSNAGRRSYIGNPTGEVNYMFLTFAPVYLSLSTCSVNTQIDTMIRLYDTCPSRSSVEAIAGIPSVNVTAAATTTAVDTRVQKQHT